MSIEVMKQALEALDCIYSPLHVREINKVGAAMDVLRQAIEQAEKQEPAAWMCSDESLVHKGYSRFSKNCEGAWNIPVYTTPQPQQVEEQEPVCDKDPRGCWSVRCQLGKVCKNTSLQPQREWVGLTDEEITTCKRTEKRYLSSQEFARAIEAKLKDKNT